MSHRTDTLFTPADFDHDGQLQASAVMRRAFDAVYVTGSFSSRGFFLKKLKAMRHDDFRNGLAQTFCAIATYIPHGIARLIASVPATAPSTLNIASMYII